MTRPDLTVAICTHENAKMLDRALARLAAQRLGLAHARRAAFAAASADLIAFVDDDCLLDPKWVAAAVAFARERPRAGAFGGRVRLLWEGEPSRLARECEW